MSTDAKGEGWTPEPWLINTHGWVVAGPHLDGVRMIGVRQPIGYVPDNDPGHLNRDRAVACVNGCKDIADPEKAIPALYAACKAAAATLHDAEWCLDCVADEAETGAAKSPAEYWRKKASEMRDAAKAARAALTLATEGAKA